MAVSTEEQLRERISDLEAELVERAREAAEKEQQLERYAADLRETFKEERARSQELRRSYMLTVRALAHAVEFRDAYTGRHAERVAAYGLHLAEIFGMRLGDQPEIEFGFLLHDVGKVAVPDAILFKPGALDEAEFALIAQHPVIGSEILREVDFLGEGKLVVRHHHERWDGTGYPDGLAGEAIPLVARVFAVADTLDAITSDRPYREGRPFDVALGELERMEGSQFDPRVVQVALRIPPDEWQGHKDMVHDKRRGKRLSSA